MTNVFKPSVLMKAAAPVIVGVVHGLYLAGLVRKGGMEQQTIIVREVSIRSNKSLNNIFKKNCKQRRNTYKSSSHHILL